MPTSANRALLIDTSVAIALVVGNHAAHEATMQALAGRKIGLAGHAWFETFSVLTRLPAPDRRSPEDALRILSHNFPETRMLDEASADALPELLANSRIAGGAVYDALVGAAASHHRLPLATRDLRAIDVYRALDVEVLLLT